jgi:CHAD domain-containing protein
MMDEPYGSMNEGMNPAITVGYRNTVPGRFPSRNTALGVNAEAQVPSGILCRFAAAYILASLEKFLAESGGVRAGDDIEPLHRMRVASRRLRAGLRTFRVCIPGKYYRRINSETQAITRALGEARDADVQIAFLKKARKKASGTRGQAGKGGADIQDPLLEAIEFLYGRLRKDRSRFQKNVLVALEKVEKKNLHEFLDRAGLPHSPATNRRRQRNPSSLTCLAADQIGRCYADLVAYEPWLQYPDATAEHHAMRIAAKNLRYTMEVFAPVYRLGLRKYISRIARLQKLLGDLHDTDVWIDTVTLLLLKERSRPRSPRDSNRPGPSVIAGLKVFQNHRERDRKRLYRKAVQHWNSLSRAHFWEDLTREVLENQRVRYRYQSSLSDTEVRENVQKAMRTCQEIEAHSRHVAMLSLQLFDHLMEIHHLSKRERTWLEFGAFLHDVGLKEGKKGHAKRSSALISMDERLPFSILERGVIGVLAHSHRGRGSFGRSGFYRLLPEQEQYAVRVAAGILRVADGLDGTHRGKIESLACEVSADEICLTVSARSDCSREISMALSKADLFEHTCMKILKIRQAAPLQGSP